MSRNGLVRRDGSKSAGTSLMASLTVPNAAPAPDARQQVRDDCDNHHAGVWWRPPRSARLPGTCVLVAWSSRWRAVRPVPAPATGRGAGYQGGPDDLPPADWMVEAPPIAEQLDDFQAAPGFGVDCVWPGVGAVERASH